MERQTCKDGVHTVKGNENICLDCGENLELNPLQDLKEKKYTIKSGQLPKDLELESGEIKLLENKCEHTGALLNLKDVIRCRACGEEWTHIKPKPPESDWEDEFEKKFVRINPGYETGFTAETYMPAQIPSVVKGFIFNLLKSEREKLVAIINKMIEEEREAKPGDDLETTAEWCKIQALEDIKKLFEK